MNDTKAALTGLDESMRANKRDITRTRKEIKNALGTSGRWSKKMLDGLSDKINDDIALLNSPTTIATGIPGIQDRIKQNQE